MTTIVLVLFLPAMFFLPQTFHWLVVPLCLILLMRTGTLGLKYRPAGNPASTR
jgi:hypothetical protein